MSLGYDDPSFDSYSKSLTPHIHWKVSFNSLVANIGPCNHHLLLKQCLSFISQSILFISFARTGCSNKFSLSANQKYVSSVQLKFESRAEICVI